MQHRVVLMAKGGLLGAMSMFTKDGTSAVEMYDSRCGKKDAAALLPEGAATDVLERGVATSVERGWSVFFDGAPLNHPATG